MQNGFALDVAEQLQFKIVQGLPALFELFQAIEFGTAMYFGKLVPKIAIGVSAVFQSAAPANGFGYSTSLKVVVKQGCGVAVSGVGIVLVICPSQVLRIDDWSIIGAGRQALWRNDRRNICTQAC